MIYYEHGGDLYVNLTNRCPVACGFCVKQDWDYDFKGQDLGLEQGEPTLDQLTAGLKERMFDPAKHRQLVFCGFGEPTTRLAEMTALATFARRNWPGLKLRLNTVGLGDLIQGRDIVPELKSYLDMVSISLNTTDPARWIEMHRPAPKYREAGFQAVKDFIERCVKAGLRVRVTGVQGLGADLASLEEYALRVGAEFLARPQLA
ncbi:MAG TPA: radical SAM protein [Elusimicrobia bacterium]|nr:MAG: hypothetical protein A2X37_07895 [Elusimicrobia bacterium GWA2_66_18]OGR70562.1 MAG: hypothetical protein A2X40_04770 [Elusimicrobia bacterium GWC2_65_9]HAZ07662.1 radical SAM protein [Elusimicrobiota bacterium]